MSAQWQTFAALALVALAASWLALRALGKRRKPGCGHDCGCSAQKFTPPAARR